MNNEIISFEMLDSSFKSMVQHGEMILNNKVIINALISQNRKIDENGQIKITKTKVKLVINYSINGVNHITKEGQNYLDNK